MTYRVTGMTAERCMTVPARRTNRVWRVMGTGTNGTEIQLPTAMSPIKAPENAIVLARCRSPNIVNHIGF
jgi:hypothetical protein